MNSTSVDAWVAWLGSFFGEQVGDNQHADAAPVSRFTGVRDHFFDSAVNTVSSNGAFSGYRILSHQQILDLAEAIVDEVLARGPFTSLAQFINRMPDRDAASPFATNRFRLMGTLAAAINSAGINEQLHAHPSQTIGFPEIEQESEVGWRTENIPGWLNQADILSRMGSVIQVRSDTFRIRSAGYLGAEGGSDNEVKVWCEAIVQRIPDYIGEDPVDADYANLSSEGRDFGRRFVIIAFRWLDENEL